MPLAQHRSPLPRHGWKLHVRASIHRPHLHVFPVDSSGPARLIMITSPEQVFPRDPIATFIHKKSTIRLRRTRCPSFNPIRASKSCPWGRASSVREKKGARRKGFKVRPVRKADPPPGPPFGRSPLLSRGQAQLHSSFLAWCVVGCEL